MPLPRGVVSPTLEDIVGIFRMDCSTVGLYLYVSVEGKNETRLRWEKAALGEKLKAVKKFENSADVSYYCPSSLRRDLNFIQPSCKKI